MRTTTDERGKLKGTQSYDAWGTPHDQGEASAKLAGLVGFTGERQDAKLGLEYLRARWYAPDLGRFLSRDPEPGRPSDPRTLSPYAYALDDPATRVDPSGLSPLFPEPLSFTFIVDPCSGALIPVPDLADQAAKAIFGENRPGSLLQQLLPTLACNKDTYVKQVTSPKPASCLAPSPGLQPGPVWPGLGGTLTPTFTFTSNPKTGGTCGPLGGIDGALYAKAAGSGKQGSGGDDSTALIVNPARPGRLGGPLHRDLVKKVVEEIESRGLLANTETGFDIGKGGVKSSRYADVVAIDPQTGNIVEIHQVGRITKAGDPVWREVLAMLDLAHSTVKDLDLKLDPSVKFFFHPYN